MKIAIIAPDEKAFDHTVRTEVDAQDWPKCVHIFDMEHCVHHYARVVRACPWFGDDLLAACERRLRIVPVDHAFDSTILHDDFTVIGDAVQFSVLLPTGGTQLVRLTRDDIEGMHNALS